MYENGDLQFFNHTEGYIEPENDGTYSYSYQFKDQVNNVRITYSDLDKNGSINPSTEILHERNYYPFGLQQKGYNNEILSEHPYGFGGKEEQNELGLEWLDFSARNYDASLGRWMNIDPLADAQYEFTPYHYAYNSPLMYNDPSGLMPEHVTTWVNNTETGERLWVDDNYDFELDVSNDEFNQIKEDGAIKRGTSAYGRWFWKAVWHDFTTSNGSAEDELTQFMITDEIEDGLETANEISNGNYTTAVLALFLKKVQKGKKGYNMIKKLFKHGKKSKLPTPKLNRDQFKPGNKPGELIHKKTGAIYKKSHTSHGNAGNTGDQWKAWPKGTTDFGKTSKTTGTRVTIDGGGNVIGN